MRIIVKHVQEVHISLLSKDGFMDKFNSLWWQLWRIATKALHHNYRLQTVVRNTEVKRDKSKIAWSCTALWWYDAKKKKKKAESIVLGVSTNAFLLSYYSLQNIYTNMRLHSLHYPCWRSTQQKMIHLVLCMNYRFRKNINNGSSYWILHTGKM